MTLLAAPLVALSLYRLPLFVVLLVLLRVGDVEVVRQGLKKGLANMIVQEKSLTVTLVTVTQYTAIWLH